MSKYLRLRQICLVARELEPLEEDLTAILGINVCHRDPKLARFGLKNIIFPIGTSFLEIVAPIQENTSAERFIKRSEGRGGYMAIFDCDSPSVRREHAESLGIRTVNTNRQESYHGEQFHPRDCRATMIEFSHTADGESLTGPWWPAGENWHQAVTDEQAQTLTDIELESPEPDDLAEHWADILSLPVGQKEGNPYIKVASHGIRCTRSSGPRERLAALHVKVADPPRALAVAAALGYHVERDAFHLGGVDFRLETA